MTINVNFCSGCGCRQKTYDLFESSDSEEDLTRKYFKYGYNYYAICLFLEKFQYVLKKASTDISDETCEVIEREVERPSSLK